MARWPRAHVVSLAALCVVVVSAFDPPAPAASVEGLAAGLGEAAHGVVTPADVRWEPSAGSLRDYLMGRGVLFLSADSAQAPRDVYRAWARVSPEGHVLQVLGARDLTSTPLGDDHSLVISGDRAAFATIVYGQEQTVTWLDLGGERPPASQSEEGPLDHLTELVTRFEETGSPSGIDRVEVALVPPARAVGLAIGPRELAIDLVDESGKRAAAALDGDKVELSRAPAEMHAELVRRLPKRFMLWAVDTVRGWVGPAPIAWLEEHVFSVRDTLRRALFHAQGGDAEALKDPHDTAPLAPAAALDASQPGGDGVAWPPPTVPSIWKTREPGEGEWLEPRLSWNKHDAPSPAKDGPPPLFYRTFVRPDADRPYSRVILVAMDMRQLDLAMEAGTEDPKPLTGGHGPGRIPRDPAIASKVVAAFNGGFKTEHGSYGMMVNHRVLLPPQPSAATVVVLRDQRVGFGTWADTHDVTGIRGVADDEILSLRQNLDPLVDRGEVNPMGRALWGYTLPGNGMQTERSGLCVTESGQILYGWGDDVSGTALGKAFRQAGCAYAMHLDMNPHHTGFIFSKIVELKGHNYRSELLTPLMTVSPDRYIEYAPKDFFYMLLHDGTPPPIGAAAYRVDPGVQPPPAWAPSIWSATVETRDGPVEVTSLDAGRARYRIRVGQKEPDARTGASPLSELDTDDTHRVVLSLSLGHAIDKRPRGLATDGRLAFPLHGMAAEGEADTSYGELIADQDGALSIVRPHEVSSVGAHVDLAELPLLVDDGKVVGEPRHGTSPSSRGALGITPDGRVLFARGSFGTDAPLADVLLRAGCRRAVTLDRGAHAPPALLRTGTATPPRGRPEETTLFALSAPMKPRAFRFEPGATVAPAGHPR